MGTQAGGAADDAARARGRWPSARRIEDLARLERRYGAPAELALAVPMHAWEFDLLRYSKRDGRYRDATIFIPYEGRLVCIVKHGYPPGVARPPSGGVVPGEPLDMAAEREAWEETGLLVRIEQYLLRTRCEFSRGPDTHPGEHALAEASRFASAAGEIADPFERLARFARENPASAGQTEYWESHVFWAIPAGGQLAPRDTREVREVRLLDARDIEGPVHATMRASGVGGFTYRVALQEAALAELRRRGLIPPP